MWCTVLNRVLFPSHASCHDLYVPPQAVAASEHSQMLARIPSFVESFLKLDLDISALQAQLTKPLRPIWVMQDSPLPAPVDTNVIFEDFHPVICCTSSRAVVGGAEM